MKDRKVYKLPFSKKRIPEWVCPTCERGVLKIFQNSLITKQTSASEKASDHPAWDPDWIDYVYSCVLECTNPNCKEHVATSGSGGVTMDVTYDERGFPDPEYYDYYKPKYFYPNLKIISYPKDTPEAVSEELELSFSLFFCDPASSANHIRRALEQLLNHLKVKRFEVKSGKKSFISLHRRISLIPKKHEVLKDLFFAIKWLGNAGSHSHREITEDDVLDAYEIMEEVLNELFQKKKSVRKLAQEINKKKGPNRKKRA